MGHSFLFKKTTTSIYNPILILNSRGSMLVQVLISAGLTTALALTLASLLLQQNKQIKLMEQKSEIIDIKNEILMALSNPQVCGCNLNPSKLIPLGTKTAIEFNSSPATFNLTEGLRTDCEITTPPFLKSGKKTLSNLNVDHIKIASLTQVGATNNWNGRLEVKFSGSNIQLKDLSMPINVESSGSGPFQVDTCSVVDNLDQTASCKSLGGTLQNGKCIIQDPQANCQSLGGTYDTAAQKCRLNQGTTSTTDCVSIYGAGWTFNGSACVPPAGTEKGTLAGYCTYTFNHSTVIYPAKRLFGGRCSCEEGWQSVKIATTVPSGEMYGGYRAGFDLGEATTCIKN